jgi:hypothetical protein
MDDLWQHTIPAIPMPSHVVLTSRLGLDLEILG